MSRPHRLIAAALVLLLFGLDGGRTALLAAENGEANDHAANAITAASAPRSPLVIDTSRFTLDVSPNVLAQRRGFWGRDRNTGPRTAVLLGTVATITGIALLAYANRPECDHNPGASACGYGTKVIGSSVLAGGVVGIVGGAIAWR